MCLGIVFKICQFLNTFKITAVTVQITGNDHFPRRRQMNDIAFTELTGVIKFSSLTTELYALVRHLK